MKNKNKNRILIGLGLILGGVLGYLINSDSFGAANDRVQKRVKQKLSGRPKSHGLSSSFQRGVLHARENIEEQAAQIEASQH